MKLNNKGFAITAVLYGLLILFSLLVSSYLLVLSARKDRVDDLVSDVEKEYLGQLGKIVTYNLKYYITNLYVTNYDSSYNTAFDDETGMNYYAPKVRLMNDGLNSLGDKTNDPKVGNIRYYGADNSNLKNYIYFNCSNYNKQSDSVCEKWRIIGVVDGKVKIMRDDPLGNYLWDDDSNDWNTASLKDMLNEGGTYYTEIKNKNSSTLDLISSSTWYINGIDNSNIYSNSSYRSERTGGKTWNGYIALLYPSDYGYAADIKSCNYKLDEYNNCSAYNWMYNVLMDASVNYSWLITPNSKYPAHVLYVSMGTGGHVDLGNTVPSKLGVSPVIYLESDLSIYKGDGSSSKPFQIFVS